MTIASFPHVTPEIFAEIRSANRPAVLKGQVARWPIVEAGKNDHKLATYLLDRDGGGPFGVYVGPPEIDGHFFYGGDTQSENFRFGPAPLSQVLDKIFTEREAPRPQSIFIQSAELSRHMPAVRDENRLDLLPETVEPRIWIGNRTVTRVHYDLNYNLLCVVAGKRRVLLFPPEQLPNLYPGPFDRTIGGVPVGMVDPESPDLEHYPRFALAREAMEVVELEAGDALYIPYGWWHQVRALETFNVMINYWWDDAAQPARPYDALFHALLALRDAPADQKAVWQNLFEYYVFGVNGDPLSHLAPADRGSLGALTPERVRQIRQMLRQGLDQ